ncbi:transcription initiation factor TFIID subunit 4b-like isoform X2 [Cornus florida]|uniref:transcription initiation factor TFIID subunit 4b-like isoform X2 n=1 Tax=Cornus florida TaxID=4283 RepID=UPI00289D1E40|nr:transcription initiation factor TFIID subunit 4b-like isoform X2 [Cornus florida]
MDPSIMKLLEEDEDETMHSGADVEAFTAALNRDIEGDTSNSQPSDSDSALSQGSNQTSSQLFQQWQTSSQDENANCQGQQYLKGSQQQEQRSSEMLPKQHASGYENQQPQIDTSQERNCFPLQEKQSQKDCQQWQAEAEQNTLQSHSSQTMDMQNSEKNPIHVREPDRTQYPNSESQYSKLQKMSNQHPMAPEQAINPMNHGKQVPFALLLPVIQPQLDKDRAMQLQTLYIKLKKNEISKDVFVRHMRSLVGDQMLKMAVFKLQTQAARNSQAGPNQFPSQSQASVQQHHMKMQTINGKQFTKPQSLAQLHQKGFPEDPSHIPSTAAQLKSVSNNASMGNAQKSQEVEHQSVSHGMQVSQTSSSRLSTLNQEKERCTIPIQGLSKQQQQQQQLHFPQSSFPTYGNSGGNYPPFSGTNVNTSSTSLNQQPHDLQMRQDPVNQSMGASQSMNVTSLPKFERQDSFSEQTRVQGGTLSHLTNNSALQQNSAHWQSSPSKVQKTGAPSSMTYVKQEPLDQLNEQQNKSQLSTPHPQGLSAFSSAHTEQGNAIPGTSMGETFEMQSNRMGFSTSTSTAPSNSVSSSMTPQLDPNFLLSSRIVSSTSPIGPGSNGKAPTRKPYFGQKKPLEALGSSPPLSSKKQKVSGPLSDQSIEQLNDVTAVSGVNLREEEEQLFSGSKEDSRVSEASRRAVQEEEDRLILQKLPLQKKLAEIMARCDVKSISNDVERCLSLCVEERLHGLISNLIRLSKQRVDIEKARHRILITSDVRQQIISMNQKAREEWEKKQAEAEKLQKLDEPEGNPGVDGDKEKDEGRVKSLKANKEDDEKMRTTAANVAARAAVGGDDMLSKWQLMAEQARQKREGVDVPSGSQPGKDVSHNPSSAFGRNANQEAEKRGQSAAFATSGSSRKFGRNQVSVPQPVVVRKISIKDVIAVLEREPQMSKSTLIYQLHEKMRADAVAE